jgi:hypothetical protein
MNRFGSYPEMGELFLSLNRWVDQSLPYGPVTSALCAAHAKGRLLPFDHGLMTSFVIKP